MRQTTLLILGLVLLVGGLIAAEPLQVIGEPVPVSYPGDFYMNPKFSPSGNHIAVGGPSYKGLFILDFPLGSAMMLSDEIGAGFGMSWSPDGSALVTRVSRYADKHRLSQLVVLETNGDRFPINAESTRQPGVPVWDKRQDLIYLHGAETFQAYSTNGGTRQEIPDEVTYVAGESLRKTATPNTRGQLLTASNERVVSMELSPDGSRMVFGTVGQQLWIADADGENRRSLGSGSMPTWSPDGEWIACMLTTDDGHDITGSDIYLIAVDGSQRINMTRTEAIREMTPSWSPDGKWVAYATLADGRIYVQQVEGR